MIVSAFFELTNITDDHLIIVAVGYVIVFISLTALALIFLNLPKVLDLPQMFLQKKEVITAPAKKIETLTGEEAAAITAAIHLYFEEMHDVETHVLTIQKISRRYSPWSSKIYNVTNGLNKKF